MIIKSYIVAIKINRAHYSDNKKQSLTFLKFLSLNEI